MFWGLIFMGSVFLFISFISASAFVSWKGLIWASLSLSESLSIWNSTFISVVGVIVFHALVFSSLYMSSESSSSSFLLTTMVFAGAMIILISSDSLLTLFLGWDGLGVSSFFLVVWYQSWNSWDSGMVTYLSNRLGDFFLIFSFISYFSFGWVSESTAWNFGFSFLFVLACFTKSAQVPLTVWLPMAMSAPTPISALVHSSTLVTAGLLMAFKLSSFLLAKVFFLFGAFTMLVAGSISLLEMDLKKVVALSTLSQLGFMGTGLGVGILTLTLFHMMSHAFIKSALLILVGVLLHINLGSQDKRLMQVLGGSETPCLSGMMICSLALCGLGFTGGLVSKEAFLLQESMFQSSSVISFSFFLLVSFTLIYCGRLFSVGLQNVFISGSGHEGSAKMISSNTALLLLSICGAWAFSDSLAFISGVSSTWEKLIPLLMMGGAFFMWKLAFPLKFILSTLGWGLSLSQLTKGLINMSKKDRETVDQVNWIGMKWLDSTFSLLSPSQKNMYLILYFILFGMFLL